MNISEITLAQVYRDTVRCFEVKNALLKSMYCVRDCTICSLVKERLLLSDACCVSGCSTDVSESIQDEVIKQWPFTSP
jgi:hypothetical protein